MAGHGQGYKPLALATLMCF